MTTSVEEAAMALLRDTSYFAQAPTTMVQQLAGHMERKILAKGEVLVYEGDMLENVIIVESGRLLRTKLAVVPAVTVASTGGQEEEDGDRPVTTTTTTSSSSAAMVKTLSHDDRLAQSVVIDALETRGRISGLLHAFELGAENNKNNQDVPAVTSATAAKAYATISAADHDAVVWLLPKSALCETLRQPQQDCLFLLNALSREIRSGSKSLRALVTQQQQQQSPPHQKKHVVRVLCYDTANWVVDGFTKALTVFNDQQQVQEKNWPPIEIDYLPDRLSIRTALAAVGYDAVCLFVNDDAGPDVIKVLSQMGVQMIAMRCAGYDRVDLTATRAYGLTVARVPAYSPYAVAEMAMTLLMSLNRKIVMASARVHMTNFTLDTSLLGMDIHGKTVAVLGTGKIGGILCQILLGYGVQTLYCYDMYERNDLKAKGCLYQSNLSDIYPHCDIIFVMLPLLPSTYHTINAEAFHQMKDGVLLINTSRGGLIDTDALLTALQSGKVGGVGMDVYENEQPYFFQDWSSRQVPDASLLALIGQPNVLLTAHQAFFTREAVGNIVDCTLQNIADCFWHQKKGPAHPNHC